MARSLLYGPPGSAVFELTSRILQGRSLRRPGRRLNDTLVGILGRAQKKYGVPICVGTFLSNHFHLLARFEAPRHLSGFMQYFTASVAREDGPLHGRREKSGDKSTARFRSVMKGKLWSGDSVTSSPKPVKKVSSGGLSTGQESTELDR